MRWARILFLISFVVGCTEAQEKQEPVSPPVQVNVINVCTPGPTETSEIAAALARIPERPAFTPDFEVARGRTIDSKGTSDWVRLRREFGSEALVSSVQFLLTVGGKGVVETLVLHLKASKLGEPLQVSLENEVTSGTAVEVLNADTPPRRIRVERFGKPSLILARCPDADQETYESLFRTAAERLARYRAALHVRSTVAAELARLKSTAAKP